MREAVPYLERTLIGVCIERMCMRDGTLGAGLWLATINAPTDVLRLP